MEKKSIDFCGTKRGSYIDSSERSDGHYKKGASLIMENFDQNDKKDRQIDNLIDLVENHTRTERHLEQYSHIGDKDNKDHAREIQDIREEEINDLRSKLNGEDDIQTREEQIENLKDKYESAEGYIRNNKDNMNEQMLENMENKQRNRKEQLENLED